MAARKNVGGKAKLPVRQLAILAACRFSEPLAYTSVFPYLPEMIESFGVDQTNVAKWAGLTSAAFSLAQSVTAIGWCQASDRYGRKPMVILALFNTMSITILWGFSMNLPWAMVTRAGSGAFNGNVGIMRTMVAEIVPEKELQPRAFSVLPLVWAFGSTVGPAFGGFFANPAKNFPGLFEGSRFFNKFPFALPNLMAACFFAISITVAILFLKETLESRKNRPDYGLMLGEKILRFFQRSRKDSRRESGIVDESTTPLLSEFSSESGSSTGVDREWPPENAKTLRPTQLPPPGIKEIFTPQTTVALITYCFLALHSVSFDQLLPVFLHHPVQVPGQYDINVPLKFSGGFGLDSGRIGTLFAIFGICGGLVQFLIFPPVARRYGVLKCYRACTVILPIIYFATPLPALIQQPLIQQAVILGLMVVKSFCVVFAFPSVIILLTNSTSSVRVLGTVNGLATSFSAIGRAVGPALSGVLFTWGVGHDYVILPWWTLGFIAAVGIVPAWKVKEANGFAPKDGIEEYGSEDEDAQLPVSTADDDGDRTTTANERELDLDAQAVKLPTTNLKTAERNTQAS